MAIRIGRVERAFAVLLVLYLLASYASLPGLGFLQLAVLITGAWTAIRLARIAVKELLWRLRNRLIVAYFFIAVVPILLITALAGLGTALVGGQLSIYLVTSELDRRTASLRNSIDYLTRNTRDRDQWAATIGPYLQTRFPGLEICVRDAASIWKWPDGATMPPPADGWKDTSGLVMRDGQLYGWTHIAQDARSVTAAFPITREYLGSLAPDIGESTVLLLKENRAVVHPNSNTSSTPSRNRMPPAVNWLDFPIWWGTPLSVDVWDKPGAVQLDTWFTMRTRPSAVLRAVFTQEVDFANELIPVLFFGVAILFLIAEIIAFIVGVSLTKTITGAVHDMYEGTIRARQGDFSHRIPIHGRDQLTELAVSFNEMTENMERLLRVEKERERLQAELEIAREVQNQLYPRSVPELPSLRLVAVCDPARMVSGDYYDYQALQRDKVAIAIGDVAGKGISAALLMATVQSSFRTQLRGSIEIAAAAGDGAAKVTVSTSTVVSHLNQQLFADTSPEKYATFFLGVYDEPTGTLTYTNAGHLPPILLHEGTTVKLDVNGTVVGAFPFSHYGESSVALQPGDLLVFYTDGVTEPENEYGEMFGEARMIDLVQKNAHLDESEIIGVVSQAVRQWTGSDELQDDMTLLLLRRK
jgi:sigma-B regulation protein RsbU (phosphoserine phosphatase)